MEKDPNTQDQNSTANSEVENEGMSPMPAPEGTQTPLSDDVKMSEDTKTPTPLSADAESPMPKPVSPASLGMPETPSMPTVPDVAPQKPKMSITKLVVFVILGLCVLGALAFTAYIYGNNHGYANGKNDQKAAEMTAEMKVPTGATMISQCTAGEGTQYVLPTNIPQGPIYNVWNNKVTGVEYMVAQSNIANAKTQDLTLLGQQFNHVDIMYEPAGHAGFTEPHYHLIFSLISYADEQKIMCGSGTSQNNMSM